jgi:prophage maintenance system killer protein
MASIRLPNYLNAYIHPGLRYSEGIVERAKAKRAEDPALFKKTNITVIDGNLTLIGVGDIIGSERVQNFCNDVFAKLKKLPDEQKPFLLNINSLLTHMPQQQNYRTKPVIYFHKENIDGIIPHKDLFREMVRKDDPKKLPIFDLYQQQIPPFLKEIEQNPYEDPIEESKSLPRPCKDLIKTYFSIAIPPQFLEKKMEEFHEQLKAMLSNPNSIPIEVAAFAHMRLVKLHPFGDGNGRTARLFMNLILMKYGYPPLYFYSEQEYDKAVKAGLKDPASFAQYIAAKVSLFQSLHKNAQELFSTTKEQEDYIQRAGITTCLRVHLT